MDTTSSSAGREPLDDSLVALRNNVYGKVESAPRPATLGRNFAESGWKVRKSSITDYEIECGWAAIEFACDGEVAVISFAGVVEPNRVPELIAVLSGMGAFSTIELYGSDGRTLLRRYTS
ncbi:hypothetical protein AB0N05_11320 [Nocardia sp. NPDC051030]|uniref:hypothetical protein n=1 Tax=Nocardia sp. NPDC051030 TaxID=3155162 RepID=UPI00341849BE